MSTAGNGSDTKKYKSIRSTEEVNDSDDDDKEYEKTDVIKKTANNEFTETTKLKTKCSKFCPILHPFGAFKICWDILISIAVVISAIEIPLTMAFIIPIDFSTGIGITTFCIDILLCCDIFVTFRTAYYDEWDPLRLIVNPKIIAIRYTKTWFFFDFLTSFPFAFVFNDFKNAGLREATRGIKILRSIRLLRLLRVFRIYKMLGIMREMNRLFPTLKKWFGMTQVMVFMLFVAHYFACLWFAVGKQGQRKDWDSWLDYQGIEVDDPSYNVKVAYSTSMYWSIVLSTFVKKLCVGHEKP